MLTPDLLLQSISNTVFGLTCHQDTSILIELNGRTLMLCPRCSGLHIGFMLAWLCNWFPGGEKTGLKGSFTKWFAILSISFLFVEWLLAQNQVITSSTESRYLSGLFAGAACFLLVMVYQNTQMRQFNIAGNHSQLKVIVRTAAALLAGVLFSRLHSWLVVTASLLVAVVFNFLFFLFTLLMRVRFILSNHKIRMP